MTTSKDQIKAGINFTMVWEIVCYVAIFLTICGQIIINYSALAGQVIWMVANILYLAKAYKCSLGRSETVRNVCMCAVTTGCIILNLI